MSEIEGRMNNDTPRTYGGDQGKTLTDLKESTDRFFAWEFVHDLIAHIEELQAKMERLVEQRDGARHRVRVTTLKTVSGSVSPSGPIHGQQIGNLFRVFA